MKLGYSEIKNIINQEINEKIYQTDYNNNQNYYVKKFRKRCPNIKNNIYLDKNQHLVNRLRARATRINHFNDDIFCRKCRVRLDYKHVLKNCQLFDRERYYLEQELLRTNLKFTITNILRTDHDKSTNKAVFQFLKRIDDTFPI